jgi:hypothetical protein
MSENSAPMKTKWLDVRRPFLFGLTQDGELTVEWSFPSTEDDLRLGIVIPVEEVKTLQRGLQENQTILETLFAKLPTQGAH